MRTTRPSRTIPPHEQPLRPAIALLVVAVLLLVIQGVVRVLPLLLVDRLEASLPGGPLPPIGPMLVAGFAIVALVLGLGLATFLLAVIVAVKGDGKLRIGAALMLTVFVVEVVFSFSVSGDTSQVPDVAVAISRLFSLLETLIMVAKALALVVGAVFLALGIRTVRRRRAELALD
ncbi:hypothetical protein [Brachybacterium sp.]|uniref:hypothetical protein n=1 Tax=Brachybacterium sp. TaxID=1891286 RepID=UPI002ED34CF9